MGSPLLAILFMMLFVSSIVVGVFVAAFAARCVLVIVQETGLGQDEIIWPSEPYVDWLGHAVQFLELVGIWLAPSALAARLLRDVWLPEDGALRVLLLVCPGLWLFFPVGLLSSLSAQSRWVPFRWAILRRFLRVLPAAMFFYFLTSFLFVLGVLPWYSTLFGGKVHWLPVATLASVVALFIYSRLLGRLAWIVQGLPTIERPPSPAKTQKPVKQRIRKKKPKVHDPWAVPQEEIERRKAERFPWAKDKPEKASPRGYHVPSVEEIEGYGFAADKPAEPEPPLRNPPRSSPPNPPEVYKATALPSTPEAEPPFRETQSELFAEQVRQRLAERTHEQPMPPAHPFFSGVFSFPFYGACLPNELALGLAFLVFGGLLFQMMQIGGQLFGW